MASKRRSASPAARASRASHACPAGSPAASSQNQPASRCGYGTPSAPSSSADRSSTAPTVAMDVGRRGTLVSVIHPLLLACLAQSLQQIVELAVEHVGQIVRRKPDAVIGDAILGKVVGADLRRAIARAHL